LRQECAGRELALAQLEDALADVLRELSLHPSSSLYQELAAAYAERADVEQSARDSIKDKVAEAQRQLEAACAQNKQLIELAMQVESMIADFSQVFPVSEEASLPELEKSMNCAEERLQQEMVFVETFGSQGLELVAEMAGREALVEWQAAENNARQHWLSQQEQLLLQLRKSRPKTLDSLFALNLGTPEESPLTATDDAWIVGELKGMEIFSRHLQGWIENTMKRHLVRRRG
jgi:hypothetical protein